MTCEIVSCKKEITEGQFLCLPAQQHTNQGMKSINLFLVVCSNCIESKGLKNRVSGSIRIIPEAPISIGENI